jgi:hypothetical protein
LQHGWTGMPNAVECQQKNYSFEFHPQLASILAF